MLNNKKNSNLTTHKQNYSTSFEITPGPGSYNHSYSPIIEKTNFAYSFPKDRYYVDTVIIPVNEYYEKDLRLLEINLIMPMKKLKILNILIEKSRIYFKNLQRSH